jgi:hypothetical protein
MPLKEPCLLLQSTASKTPTTPPRHTPKRPNRRIHLQPLNIRIPLNRLQPPPNNHPQTRIPDNHKAKRHRDEPVERTQTLGCFEDEFDAGQRLNICIVIMDQ